MRRKTAKKSHNSTVIMTAHGKSEATKEATLYIIDLDIFATVMSLNNYIVVSVVRENDLLQCMETRRASSLSKRKEEQSIPIQV